LERTPLGDLSTVEFELASSFEVLEAVQDVLPIPAFLKADLTPANEAEELDREDQRVLLGCVHDVNALDRIQADPARERGASQVRFRSLLSTRAPSFFENQGQVQISVQGESLEASSIQLHFIGSDTGASGPVQLMGGRIWLESELDQGVVGDLGQEAFQ
jgi:hypothetical protein